MSLSPGAILALGIRTAKMDSNVSILRKITHKAETIREADKKGTGCLTGNRRLKAEGRVVKITGNGELAADKVSDAFKH